MYQPTLNKKSQKMLLNLTERKDMKIESRLMSLTARHQAKVQKLEVELTP